VTPITALVSRAILPRPFAAGWSSTKADAEGRRAECKKAVRLVKGMLDDLGAEYDAT